MKKILLAIAFAIMFSSSAFGKTVQKWHDWRIVTKIDAFDNSKSVDAFLPPKKGIAKGIWFVVSCIKGEVILGLSNTGGKITNNTIGLRQNVPSASPFFLQWLIGGPNLYSRNVKEDVKRIKILSGVVEYLVRIESDGSNETLTFDLGAITVPYQKVKENCK